MNPRSASPRPARRLGRPPGPLPYPQSRLAIAGFCLALLGAADPALAQDGAAAGGWWTPQLWLQAALTWVDGLGAVGAIAFALLYVVATVAFLPGSLLTLGAGVLFGVVWGSVVVFCGATLGAALAFLVGRYLARDWVADRFIRGNKRFAAIDRAVGREGFKIVLLTRLSPVFPFNALNYIYGLTGVGFKDYLLASVGMIPGTIMYVYIGSLFGNLADLFAGVEGRAKTPAEYALYGFGLVVTVAVTVYVTRIARRALDEAVGDSPGETRRDRGTDGSAIAEPGSDSAPAIDAPD